MAPISIFQLFLLFYGIWLWVFCLRDYCLPNGIFVLLIVDTNLSKEQKKNIEIFGGVEKRLFGQLY